ncbi:MAG: AAA-like domain-containing protein [Pleurocapsa sp. MO_192.B19]|nr:AAA-like domain-containing protein [Pleurocapsa sp. MO_192.B19]
MSDLSPVKKILILSANPKGTSQLRLDEEVREIKEGLRRSKRCEQFVIESSGAVRSRDIRRAILDYEPQIVHFSGHGIGSSGQKMKHNSGDRKLSSVPEDVTESGGLVFEDETGQAKLVDGSALAGLFELFADSVECVVLNACYSKVQSQAIAQHIPYVVGMNKAIGDKAAIEFAVGFYDGLGAGRDYVFAHKLGCSAVRMAGIKENLTPVLIQSPKLVAVPAEKVKNHDYYIHRPPIEEICFNEIEQEGALLRIKAPKKMGKRLLLKKIFEYVGPKNYGRVRIDLQRLESSILADSSQFLQWLCRRVTRKLKLEDCLEDYWEGVTPNTGCSDYFEEHILESLETPLLLAIDNIDRLFAPEFQSITADFFGLLRSWWGEAQTTGGNWTKLRLIVIYSTEDLPKLNIYQSPFNVGTEIKLPEFEDKQVLELALRYGLNWSLTQIRQLKEQIGGHPYLVHEAIKNLTRNPTLTLNHLLEKAATDEGIYAHHLQHHWSTLEQEPALARQLKTICEAKEPTEISPTYLYKLDSMGLIAKIGNQVQPRCQIYRQYFRERLRVNEKMCGR